MSMQLTILGCYGPYPPAGGACSGYLVQEEDCNLLLDCGNGVLSRLQEFIAYQDLDAVLLSHLHADHISDLMIMRYGLMQSRKGDSVDHPLPLYTPKEPAEDFNRLPYKSAYDFRALDELSAFEIGPFKITVSAGVHAVPVFGFRLESSSGILVYSGDTEMNQNIGPFAAAADLLLCEANYLEEDIAAGLPNHLSAAQAAAIAAEAGVKKLLLTHLHPERDSSLYLAEAQKLFPAAELARERFTYTL
jgi:ribonuclease BN (tRNA processing enzyme)